MKNKTQQMLRPLILGVWVLLGLMSFNAQAVVIYDFSGDCNTGCSGTVTGILTLSDAYSPGASLAESSDSGGFFISFERYINSVLDLTITSTDYALVAGTTDPYHSVTAAGDGPLPSIAGIPTLADIYIVNRVASVGLNDYTNGGGVFNTVSVTGTNGMWTLRGAVPEPATLALMSLGLAGIGFARKKKAA